MKRVPALCAVAGLALACLAASGCAYAYGPSGLPALISTTTVPVAAGPDTDAGGKRGEATAVNVLGLFSFGNASVRSAANDGSITKIKTVDAQVTNILFLYSSYTTQVTGD